MPHTPHAAERPVTARLVDRALAALCGLAFLALCGVAGARREALEAFPRRWRHAEVSLAYGDRLPHFRLASASGAWLDNGSLRGGWAALVFSSPWCEACTHELRALSTARGSLGRYVRILPVAEGRSGFMSPAEAVRRYFRRNRLPFEFLLDPGESFGTACGAGAGYPYVVLTDPTGTVRLATRGSWPTANGSTRLVDGLTAFFTGSAPASMPMAQWNTLPRALDLPVTVEGGRCTHLADLWGSGTLILTFLTGLDPREAVRIDAVRRAAGAPQAHALFVASAPAARPPGLRESSHVLVSDHQTRRLFAAYGVDRGPVSVIIHRGRTVVQEAGVQQSGEAFEQELAYAILLGSPDTAYRAAKEHSRRRGPGTGRAR